MNTGVFSIDVCIMELHKDKNISGEGNLPSPQTVEKPGLSKCYNKNVGAAIDRPAVGCYGFAENHGEFVDCATGRLIIAPTILP